MVCRNEKQPDECHNKVCCGWHFEQFVPYNDEEQRHEEYAYGDKIWMYGVSERVFPVRLWFNGIATLLYIAIWKSMK